MRTGFDLAPSTQWRATIGDKAVSDVEIDVRSLPVVCADQNMLRLVFLNLIDNALKYSRGRRPARIVIGSLEEAVDEDTFFVRDNGVGFDLRYADKLFSVFQRLHHADEFEGTGIGLANVRRIVLKHGGRVWAEAIVGEGATFYFSLGFLQCRGRYAGREPDLPLFILLDLKMPRLDGLEVLRQARADPQLATVPIVVMTSSREHPDLKRAYELGANAYVVKPVRFEEFREAVTALGMFWAILNEAPPKPA